MVAVSSDTVGSNLQNLIESASVNLRKSHSSGTIFALKWLILLRIKLFSFILKIIQNPLKKRPNHRFCAKNHSKFDQFGKSTFPDWHDS